jgi:hypothetical protein
VFINGSYTHSPPDNFYAEFAPSVLNIELITPLISSSYTHPPDNFYTELAPSANNILLEQVLSELSYTHPPEDLYTESSAVINISLVTV